VVVENRAGGGGAVGVGSIVGKKPDGHLLAVVVASLHRASYINKLPFDTVKDLTPIIQIGGYQYAILVRPDSPFKTLQDFAHHARANPGKINYMGAGVGTGGHIIMEEFAAVAGGLKLNHIPSKGDAESSTALLGGHVDIIASSAWIPLVEAGQLRALATFGTKRTTKFPDLPTATEQGFKVVHESPIGLVGPKGLPPEIVKVLHDAFKEALKDKDFLAAMDKQQMPVLYQDTAGFAKFWTEAHVEAGEHVRKYIQK
jgi:tripartite-type tricarboxylate transporter receptor subunit TctC